MSYAYPSSGCQLSCAIGMTLTSLPAATTCVNGNFASQSCVAVAPAAAAPATAGSTTTTTTTASVGTTYYASHTVIILAFTIGVGLLLLALVALLLYCLCAPTSIYNVRRALLLKSKPAAASSKYEIAPKFEAEATSAHSWDDAAGLGPSVVCATPGGSPNGSPSRALPALDFGDSVEHSPAPAAPLPSPTSADAATRPQTQWQVDLDDAEREQREEDEDEELAAERYATSTAQGQQV